MRVDVAEWVGTFYERYPADGEEPVYKGLTVPGMRAIRGGNFMPAYRGPGPMELLRTYWRAGALNDMRSAFVGFCCAR